MSIRRAFTLVAAMAAVIAAAVAIIACGNLSPTAAAPQRARPALDPIVRTPDTQTIAVYWLGHATTLIRLEDRWILTDPNFAGRVGLIEKRRVAPGIDLDAMPKPDWILISHAHVDHLDPDSIARVPHGAQLAIPPGVEPYLPWRRDRLGVAAVTIFEPWQTVVDGPLRITAVPARHSNGRFGVDALWSRGAHTGYIIEYGTLCVYFAGDTGYDAALFKRIGERFSVDVALLPVGPADRPAWVHNLRKEVHASPADAMAIFADVGAQWMVPIHYGTFFKSGAGERRELDRAIADHPLGAQVRVLPIGGDTRFIY